MAKKIVSIKVDEELLEEFDNLEGARSSNIVKAMEQYLEGITQKYQSNTKEYQGITQTNDELERRIENLEENNKFLKDRIMELEIANSELRKSLAYEQQAHFEAQRQLSLPPKKWWQFWRKQ